jgi:hypothetical protein
MNGDIFFLNFVKNYNYNCGANWGYKFHYRYQYCSMQCICCCENIGFSDFFFYVSTGVMCRYCFKEILSRVGYSMVLRRPGEYILSRLVLQSLGVVDVDERTHLCCIYRSALLYRSPLLNGAEV